MNTLLLILQKHGVLTLRAIEMTAIIIINVTPKLEHSCLNGWAYCMSVFMYLCV